MRVRMLGLVAVVGLLQFSVAGAASGFVDVYAGAERCAYATGKVPGGTAYVTVCHDGYAGLFTSIGSSPFPSQPGILTIEARVATTAGTDTRYSTINLSSPNTAQLSGFVMDPAMQTATIKLSVSTITIDLTLNAKTEAPTPDEGAGEGFSQSVNPTFQSACAHADAGAGVIRKATLAPGAKITSSTKGGGALSASSGSMWTGAGAGGFAVATSSSGFFFC